MYFSKRSNFHKVDIARATRGMDDSNTGTFPIQSERLYQAIKGMGGSARLVMLPCESHGYRARESVMHVLWEMDRWLDTYVKKYNTNR